jgi:hypothetical protein
MAKHATRGVKGTALIRVQEKEMGQGKRKKDGERRDEGTHTKFFGLSVFLKWKRD